MHKLKNNRIPNYNDIIKFKYILLNILSTIYINFIKFMMELNPGNGTTFVLTVAYGTPSTHLFKNASI